MHHQPSPQGNYVIANGSEEFRTWWLVPAEGTIARAVLLAAMQNNGIAPFGLGAALKNGWLNVDEQGALYRAQPQVYDAVGDLLTKLDQATDAQIDALIRRGLLV